MLVEVATDQKDSAFPGYSGNPSFLLALSWTVCFVSAVLSLACFSDVQKYSGCRLF